VNSLLEELYEQNVIFRALFMFFAGVDMEGAEMDDLVSRFGSEEEVARYAGLEERTAGYTKSFDERLMCVKKRA
jgi:hypothetical protein